MHSEWRERLEHWDNTLKQDIYRPIGEIRFEGCLTMEHLSLDEAARLDYRPMPAGTAWGKTWQYCWLRADITLPKKAADKRIAMNLPTGGEATVFVNGQAFGTCRAHWVSDRLHYIVDNVLTRQARGGETFSLYIESYAGHYFPESALGGCATGPVLPGAYRDPKAEGERAVMGRCTFGEWNEDAYQLMLDVRVLSQLMDQTDPESLRADAIASSLEQYSLTADFEQNAEGRGQSYRAARQALAPALAAVNGSTAPVFYAVGNAHLDLAWLWPMAETHRKTARTFAAQLRLLDEYPDYLFLQSQPASYEMCAKYYPELFEKVKQAVKDGRWIADGAMYVEPDTNMTSGESLIRQLLYGKQYFKDEFGVNSELLWLPDTFGYSAALPQILKGCGVKYLVTQKIFWSYNEGDQFPYHYFTWQGADGSGIDTFLPTSYTYRTDPKEISETWKKRAQKRGLSAFLLPYGYGDGGAGPCRDDVEHIKREHDLEGLPKLRHASPLTFFRDMEQAGGPRHTYVGELYFSAHRGVYTTQAAIKKGNRKGELALREAEVWGALAALKGFAYPHGKMDGCWKLLLLNQFHDILPGSSIARVYEEARAQHRQIIGDAAAAARAAAKALTNGSWGVTIFNSLSFPREAVISLPEEFKGGAQTRDGKAVPVQAGENGALAHVVLPSMGALSLVPARADSSYRAVRAELTGEGAVLENELVKAVLNSRGEVISFISKSSRREYAGGSMNRFLLYKDVPRKFDAWDIDSNYELQPVDTDGPVKLSVKESGGLRAVIRLERGLLSSVLTQDITLEYNSPRLDFVTHVEWAQTHRLLKVAFPVNVQATEGINEIQFGYITRPSHRSKLYDADRFEVCNQRYSALCDQRGGAALLNDCKYGISMHFTELRLTLLRGAASPEMSSDQGPHEFTYSFIAWEGSFLEAPVTRQAYTLNVPPLTLKGAAQDFSAFDIDAANVFIDTVKPAHDRSGDLILRLYEAKKAATACMLSVNFPFKSAALCDMLENALEDLCAEDGKIRLHFGTFEVKTLRISI